MLNFNLHNHQLISISISNLNQMLNLKFMLYQKPEERNSTRQAVFSHLQSLDGCPSRNLLSLSCDSRG